VDVFESHHAEDWRMEPTRHDFLKILLILQGEGVLERSDGLRIACRRGSLLVVPIGQEHRLEDAPGKPMSLYVVSVRPAVLKMAAVDPRHIPVGRVVLDRMLADRVGGTIRQLLFEQTTHQHLTGAKVVSLALHLLSELMRLGERARRPSADPQRPAEERGARPDSTSRVRAYVQELEGRFFETTNLDGAAAGMGLSRRRFTQLFREVTGTSWLVYLRRLRVDHARRLLAGTERTVLSIAFECGFEDLSTFYRAFKREVGVSPNRWRAATAAGRDTPE